MPTHHSMNGPKNTSGARFALALIFFTFAVGFAFLLLLGAGIAWLSMLTGSPIVALTIAGCFSLILAVVIYLVGLRKRLNRIHHDALIITQTGRELHDTYQWVMDKISLVRTFEEQFFSPLFTPKEKDRPQ